MRVALLGNLCNTAYTFAKVLRKKNIAAEVFITEKERKQMTCYPEWEDPDIDSSKLSWIHYYNHHNPISFFCTMMKIRGFDVIHAFGKPNIYCQLLKRPLIPHALGADLKEVVHEYSVEGLLLKRVFTKSKQLYYSDIDHIPHVKQLGINQAKYFKAAVDLEKYSPPSESAKTNKDQIILFHSSYLDWTRQQPTSKRNDIFFKAFAKFVKQRNNVLLRIIAAGPDVEPTKELIRNLGFTENVEYLPPLNKQELLFNYHSCDIIVDQFGMPKFGVNALEGMASGRLVFLNLETPWAEQCYETLPPVASASNEQEIYQQLQKICDKNYLKIISSKCRNWVTANHNGDIVADELIEVYKKALS